MMILPADGYKIDRVTWNGEDVGVSPYGGYSFVSRGDCTLELYTSPSDKKQYAAVDASDELRSMLDGDDCILYEIELVFGGESDHFSKYYFIDDVDQLPFNLLNGSHVDVSLVTDPRRRTPRGTFRP